MAIFKTANKKGKYHDDEARYDILRYILQEHKLPHRCFMGYNFPGLMIEDPTRAAAYMQHVWIQPQQNLTRAMV